MEQVPKMMPLTSGERQVRLDYEEKLSGWHSSGRPPRGLYSYKLDFGAEILREHPPTLISSTETYRDRSGFRSRVAEGVRGHLDRRRAFHMAGLQSDVPEPVLYSEDVTVRAGTGNPGSDENWIGQRHGDCHELYFVHRAPEPFAIATDFGLIDPVRQGDFVYIPRGTTYAFHDAEEVSLIAYETPHRLYRPYDYWMGEQQPWPFPPEATRPPKPVNPGTLHGNREEIHEVIVKQRDGDYSLLTYDTPVFDVVAWEGEVWPFALNIEDMNVLTSPDFHLDPPKVTCFVDKEEQIYIQTFLPRWMQSPPYNHMNQVDEALLNHSGYEARPDIGDGYLTLHPSGVPHGPDPDVVDRIAEEGHPDSHKDIPWADEIGVMIESITPFQVLPPAEQIEVPDYHESWAEGANE